MALAMEEIYSNVEDTNDEEIHDYRIKARRTTKAVKRK